MGLLGSAAIVIWNGIAPNARDDFLAWHNREHIPERVRISGFRRGRRGRAFEGKPEFLTLYEVKDLGVLRQGDYLARLNSPTAWTRRMLPQFRDAARSLCQVSFSVGAGVGGYICAVRFETEPNLSGEALKRFRAAAEDRYSHSADLLGVHYLLRDDASSGQELAEHRLRTEAVATPAAVILVEGTSPTVLAAAESLTRDIGGLSASPNGGAEIGLYQHELCLTAADWGPA